MLGYQQNLTGDHELCKSGSFASGCAAVRNGWNNKVQHHGTAFTVWSESHSTPMSQRQLLCCTSFKYKTCTCCYKHSKPLKAPETDTSVGPVPHPVMPVE